MRKLLTLVILAIAMALAGSGVFATTTMWLSTDALGTAIPGNTLNVQTGATIQLYAFLNSDQVGNIFELMLGYDTSDATTYGAHKDTNNGANKKLTLASAQAAIEGTMPGSFTALRQAVLDASGREASNSSLGGRPYGFVGRAGTFNNAAPGQIQCFSFTLTNNMTTVGDAQYVVLSNQAGGNSYSDAWKYGVSLRESSYALRIVETAPKLMRGASNKAMTTTVVGTAASQYDWLLWGKVTTIDSSSFNLDDGSGQIIKVVCPGYTVVTGDYVSVKGSINTTTTPPTLTGQVVRKYN